MRNYFCPTNQELYVKKHTVDFVMKQVRHMLAEHSFRNKVYRNGGQIPVCLDKLPRHYDSNTLLTTVEASDLIERMYFDSLYYR